MTYTEMQTALNALLEIEGWTNTVYPLDTATAINNALREFSMEAEYINDQVSSLTTTAGTHTYTLPTYSWKRVTDVIVNTNQNIRQVTETQLRLIDPLWTQAPNGTPAFYIWTQPNKIRLHPTPDTSSQTIFVRGIRAEASLSAGSDVPLLDASYHRAIPLLAAWEWARQYAQGEAYARAESYYTEAMKYAQRIKDQNAGQQVPVVFRTVLPRYGRMQEWWGFFGRYN